MGKQSGFNRAAVLGLGILLMAGSASVSVSAPVFDGDVCWTIKINQDENGTVVNPVGRLAKFHVVSLDPTTFAMTGAVTVPGDSPFIMTGTATLRGASIITNLVGTQDHKVSAIGDLWRDTAVLRATFNSTTLNGSVFSIGQSYDRANRNFGKEDYSSGTLTYRACP